MRAKTSKSQVVYSFEPVVRWTLRRKWAVISGAVALVVLAVPVFLNLGSEFMPPLDEGVIPFSGTAMMAHKIFTIRLIKLWKHPCRIIAVAEQPLESITEALQPLVFSGASD